VGGGRSREASEFISVLQLTTAKTLLQLQNLIGDALLSSRHDFDGTGHSHNSRGWLKLYLITERRIGPNHCWFGFFI
jgi:hypothetical protein